MTPSDFDLLCAGASAEETRRLAKMLREWSDGDENGFPAQIALLTRAQWRVAATVPGSVQDARKSLDATFLVVNQQLHKSIEVAEAALGSKIAGLRTVVEDHSRGSATKLKELNQCVVQVEALSKKTRQELEAGAATWKAAVKDFEGSSRRLNQLIADLQSRPWRSHWVMGILLILAAGAIGYLLAKLGLV